MLPDFPEVKSRAQRLFLKAVQQRILANEPLLREIPRTRVHEGRTAKVTRSDFTVQEVEFTQSSAELMIPRDQMRRITIEQLDAHIASMADQFASQQAKLLLTRMSEASDSVGNSISARELGAKEAFLETQRRLQMDFDEATLEPKNLVLVIHPSQLETITRQIAEWETDPAFVAELARIRLQKLEEWRARENSRQLVD